MQSKIIMKTIEQSTERTNESSVILKEIEIYKISSFIISNCYFLERENAYAGSTNRQIFDFKFNAVWYIGLSTVTFIYLLF